MEDRKATFVITPNEVEGYSPGTYRTKQWEPVVVLSGDSELVWHPHKYFEEKLQEMYCRIDPRDVNKAYVFMGQPIDDWVEEMLYRGNVENVYDLIGNKLEILTDEADNKGITDPAQEMGIQVTSCEYGGEKAFGRIVEELLKK